MRNLTLIIPAKNEPESLPKVLSSLESLNCNIIVSLKDDDISTIESIKNFNLFIHKQSGNGYGNALWEAINLCKTEWFCIFNADGSFEKSDLIKMYDLMKDNEFIYGSRYLKDSGSDDDTMITFIGNKIFSLLGKILFSLKINDILYTYVMGSVTSFKQLKIKSNDFKFCVEMPIKMAILKKKYQMIPSYEKRRIGGKKKVNALKDGFLILTEIIRLFIIHKILRQEII
tara:strand:- start:503 stop:1189 length:687 start_codon:yes stop_codon:yes gene_type:complete